MPIITTRFTIPSYGYRNKGIFMKLYVDCVMDPMGVWLSVALFVLENPLPGGVVALWLVALQMYSTSH